MSLIRLNKNPSPRQLFVFGVAWLIVFGVYGAVASSKHHLALALGLWSVGLGFAVPGFIYQPWMRRGYLVTSYATFPVGIVVSYFLLAVVYYGVLTPLGCGLRLFGYDPLSRRKKSLSESYWRPRKEKKSVESYFRQY